MTNKHVEAANRYPHFSNGYTAVGASAADAAELAAAGFKLQQGKWYGKGYSPVRGGWGYVGTNGLGYGPVYRGD